MRKLLSIDWLSPHYDKLLHALGTFFAYMWLVKAMDWRCVVISVVLLQVLKAVWNYALNPDYRPWGDFIANGVGWLLGWLYFQC